MKKIRALLFLISLGMLAVLIWYSNPVAMASLIEKSSKVYIIAGLSVSLFAVSLRVVKWMVLLENVGFLELYPIQLVGITISNFTPGKIAEPGKAVLLKIMKNISVSASLPTIIWERILDIVVLVGFSALAPNFLSLDPQTVVVDERQTALIRLLEQRKFTAVPVRMRHIYTQGGGIHCATLDTVRDSSLEDYFS